MSGRPLPSSSVLLGEVKATVLRKYKKSASVFLEDAALDMMLTEHPGDIQRYAGFYNMVYLFLDPSHCQESNRPFANPLLTKDSTTRFIWNKKEYDCADCLVDSDDDHPESIEAAAIRPIEGSIGAPVIIPTEQVAAISKKTQKKMFASQPGENIKTRLRRVYNERQEARKLDSWRELKATVEATATCDLPAHVSTTQLHFWNAVFLDILPCLPASERAARLLALESRDVTDEQPEPWSDIWQTYQYVRYINDIETAGWEKTLRELSENYQDFSEKLMDLNLATRMALGLSVALPPVRTEATSVLAESTTSKPSTPHTPVVDTGAHRPKLLPKSQTMRKNFGLACLAEKVTVAPEVAATPAPPIPTDTNIFGLPTVVPQKAHPPFGGFTFTPLVSKTASAHPTSVLPQSAPNAQLPNTPVFDFGFAKSTFDAPNSACAPKFNGGAGFGRDSTPQTPTSSSAEQITQLVAPIVEKTKSLSVVFGAPIVGPDLLTPVEPNLFAHLNERVADFDTGNENGNYLKSETRPAIKSTRIGRSYEPVLDIIVEEPVEQTSEEPEEGDMERNFDNDHEDDDDHFSRSVVSSCWLTTEDDFKYMRDAMSLFRESKSRTYTVGEFAVDYIITRGLDLPAEDLVPRVTEFLNTLPFDHRSFVQTRDEHGVEAAASFEEALEFFEPHLIALSTVIHIDGAPPATGISMAHPEDVKITTTVQSAPIMAVVPERQAMYEDDESYNCINGYEYLIQIDCSDHDSQADGGANIDRPDALDELMPDTRDKSPSFECGVGIVDSDSASTVTLTPSLTHSPISEAELAIDTEMAEEYMLDGYGRPLQLTGMPRNDKKFFEAVHTKIVADADQYEFDWAEVECLLGPQDEEDDDDDYVVPTVDDDGKPIKFTLDIEPLQDGWAQGVLKQVFPDFEQAEAKLPDVAPQLQVEVDQTSFSAMLNSGYMSDSVGIPENTSVAAAKLPKTQLVDTLMSSLGSIFVDYDTLLHERYAQVAAVGTDAEDQKAGYHLPSLAVRTVQSKAVPTENSEPLYGIGTSSSVHMNLAARSLMFNQRHPVRHLPHSDLAVYDWLKSQPDNSLANISANGLGEHAPFDVIKLCRCSRNQGAGRVHDSRDHETTTSSPQRERLMKPNAESEENDDPFGDGELKEHPLYARSEACIIRIALRLST
ncbi:uncharacterized protein J4E84_007127 [Alternaria hordeiaustralica]|uniref:uncharacterized protein n=1 Tax=Alternaria hordeiaustralica TaxID=1187925 RepID=UPI0020C4DECA|nr:uncharacterized protein J4E84_007127 [Alternaria hordeiaustralica]KAI4682663.1 hypothetical protein J4E84_007127 [Alternaria hordeiaustralica]